jgi:hypothetical protein
MHTFAQKPKTTQQTTSAKSPILRRAHFCQNREVSAVLHLQRTIGNQAVRGLLEANTRDVKGDSTTEIARFGHDFSRISIHSPTAEKIQTKLPINKPGDYYEQEADSIADQVRTAAFACFVPARHSHYPFRGLLGVHSYYGLRAR